ncbi:MAG: DegV family protein [Candidatus Eremiobacteraeota bacterium]|nr:DegV family protein [Candidatus Eremiobacteraeota bacterium]
MGIAIVTDSTSDIEPNKARELGIDVIPLFVVFGEKSYRDYIDLSREDFYNKLAHDKVLPTTSQPTAAMFEEVFAKHVEAGDEIICLLISQALSGTINAARAAAQRFPDAKIHLVDTQSVAGGLGLQVFHAVEMVKTGASAQEILNALQADRHSQRLFAALPDLSHVVRTGRIGKAKAALGTLMKIVPVITLKEGVVEAAAQVRTFARAQEAMIDATLRDVIEPSSLRLMVMHTKAPDVAQKLAARLLERIGTQPKSVELLEAGPVIATHAGAGAVGIFSVT